MYIYIHMYTYVCIHVYTYMHAYIHTYTQIYRRPAFSVLALLWALRKGGDKPMEEICKDPAFKKAWR